MYLVQTSANHCSRTIAQEMTRRVRPSQTRVMTTMQSAETVVSTALAGYGPLATNGAYTQTNIGSVTMYTRVGISYCQSRDRGFVYLCNFIQRLMPQASLYSKKYGMQFVSVCDLVSQQISQVISCLSTQYRFYKQRWIGAFAMVGDSRHIFGALLFICFLITSFPSVNTFSILSAQWLICSSTVLQV